MILWTEHTEMIVFWFLIGRWCVHRQGSSMLPEFLCLAFNRTCDLVADGVLLSKISRYE